MSFNGRWILTALLACGLAGQSPAFATYETEEPVDFTLQQLGGGAISASDFRG